ncbi:MAG: L-serine ammonia-lyase [Betaproteobacteria bacterium]
MKTSSNISVLDLFRIGIGPSSSHTVGPMRAALMFAKALDADHLLTRTTGLAVDLYGSLGATGRGHGTDKGVILGLAGESPETCDPDLVEKKLESIYRNTTLPLLGKHSIAFLAAEQVHFCPQESLPEHPNGLRFCAFDSDGKCLREARYLSVGGGFVVEVGVADSQPPVSQSPQRYPFLNADELMAQCHDNQLSVAELMLINESAFRPEQQTRQGLLKIWQAMQHCVQRGLKNEGLLPGPLQVKRRAPKLYKELTSRREYGLASDLDGMDWLNLYAMAVNEENAAGGRVVTAPTNGAAGIIPAVLHYYARSHPDLSEQTIIDYLLTAAAIGIIYKLNASISGAEVGCQGEVGVACSMAAAALCAISGGTPSQVESAAEIGMEHNLGLTCDPVGGLVQIPCIERNAMGSVKALNAVRMALHSDGSHYVSLDAVIKTMRETGLDMNIKYKETSRGGLAVNIVEC